MKYVKLLLENKDGISEMSKMATEIVREHFDPIIGKAQNDYMIEMFQTEKAIKEQIESEYNYYFVRNEENTNIGFLAFYPKKDVMYLSKFYLYKSERGNGYARQMMEFVIKNAKELKVNGIELNVNKENNACRAYESLGFKIVRSEKNSIGNGFYMDDYVYRLDF